MNNKGFAVSTLVYGLSIMGIMLIAILMGTMSNTRSNARQLSESVERELISLSKVETSFGPLPADSTKTTQEYSVPAGQSGWYRIELWGAQGGTNSYGAYTSGIIKLLEGNVLYFDVGKHNAAGYGEATAVRIDDDNDVSRYLMVAAGGGSGANAPGGTLYGYRASSISNGGSVNADGELQAGSTLIGVPSGYSVVNLVTDGVANIVGTNGGGCGYYSSKNSDTGGMSYIVGYAGSGDKEEDHPIVDGQKYYFVDGMMFPGVNAGTASAPANGKAQVTKVMNISDTETPTTSKLSIRNSKLKNVKKVKDCIKGGNASDWNANSIIPIANGVRVQGSLGNIETSENLKCRTYTLNTAATLDEVAIFHSISGKDYLNHKVQVECEKSDGTTQVQTIKATNSNTELSVTETISGIHISAYQYDSIGALPPNGSYMILPVLFENKVLTAAKTSSSDSNAVEIGLINGERRQIWSVEKLDDKLKKADNEYKIIELARYKALGITADENKVGNAVSAATPFNNYARNEPQIWKIKAVGNGTYTITSVVDLFNTSIASGNIVPAGPNKSLMIGKNDIKGQRYRLISVDYTKK